MSLDRSQVAATRADLRRNLDASGLGVADLVAWLGVPRERLEGALAVDGTDPALVWLVRDALDRVVREIGGEPDWSILTDANRRRATGWFDLRTPPPRG